MWAKHTYIMFKVKFSFLYGGLVEGNRKYLLLQTSGQLFDPLPTQHFSNSSDIGVQTIQRIEGELNFPSLNEPC